MTTLLNQALILTLVGMGMTFGAIGLLVLGMYALTALITDKPRLTETPLVDEKREEALVMQIADVVLQIATVAGPASANAGEDSEPQHEDRYRAAATAVALALALQDGAPQYDDRYRAAATAVALALAEYDPAQAMPLSVPIAADAWNNHTRGQHLTQRQRLGRT